MPNKGESGGECNRWACRRKDALWYNRSTYKFYCTACARMLNHLHKEDALHLFGGNLCVVLDTMNVKS